MSSTIWKSKPSSAANSRHGSCSARGTSAAASAQPIDAEKSAPVFSRCSSSSGAPPRTSSHWPPIIASVASTSSRATALVPYESASLNASARRASPARTAVASSYCAQTDGAPRRSASSSSAGRSSWTSENECTSSTAAAAGNRLSTRAPIASPVARQSTGRTRLPPSAWRIGSASVPSSGDSASSSR